MRDCTFSGFWRCNRFGCPSCDRRRAREKESFERADFIRRSLQSAELERQRQRDERRAERDRRENDPNLN